jgi:hypothetical protein
MDILWIILIGFVAGFVARLIMPGPNKPMGFLVTTVLGHRWSVSYAEPNTMALSALSPTNVRQWPWR